MSNLMWKDNNLLTEQRYKKLTPKYWHGSAYSVWNKDLSYWKYFYMSTSFEYAMTYAHKDNRDFGYMYLCKLNKELNIFNPRSSKDFHLLVKYLTGNPNDKDAINLVNQMVDTDWLMLFGESDRNSLLTALKELGYDGFFNYEGDKKVGLKPAIGVFDSNNISTVKVFNADEIREIINNDHTMRSHKIEQKHSYLRGEITKESAWRKISLLEEEDFIDKISDEELKDKLNVILNNRGDKNESK